jgi:hypothetical protein
MSKIRLYSSQVGHHASVFSGEKSFETLDQELPRWCSIMACAADDFSTFIHMLHRSLAFMLAITWNEA